MLNLEWSQFKTNVLVLLLNWAIIFGNAYLVLVNHDENFASDEKAYISLAKGDFDVNIAFRYRIIIPFLARLISIFLQQLNSFVGEPAGPNFFPLGFGFLVVNSFFMAMAGLVIFKITSFSNYNNFSCFVAVLAILTSGYCSYFSGVALADSLYFLSVTILFYAIQSKSSFRLFISLLIGPLAKESFWLFIPFILIFSRFIPFKLLVIQITVAGLSFLVLQYIVDLIAEPSVNARLSNIFEHIKNMFSNYTKIFSYKGLQALGSTYGFFYIIILIGIWYKLYVGGINKVSAALIVSFLITIIVHLLLSGDYGRMWYFSAPVFALFIAHTLDKLPQFIPPSNYKKNHS